MKLKGEFYLEGVPKSEINGAGSKGFGRWVRDDWGSVSFHKAGSIHDAEYYWVNKDRHRYTSHLFSIRRKQADDRFFHNMKILNKADSKTELGYYARMPVIYSYYLGVRLFGGFFI